MKRLGLAGFILVLGCYGCGQSEKREVDTPAGHPDELKDSTRLDSAKQPGDTASSSSGQSSQPKKKYRFSS